MVEKVGKDQGEEFISRMQEGWDFYHLVKSFSDADQALRIKSLMTAEKSMLRKIVPTKGFEVGDYERLLDVYAAERGMWRLLAQGTEDKETREKISQMLDKNIKALEKSVQEKSPFSALDSKGDKTPATH